MHSDNSLLAPPIEDINDNGKLYSNVGHNSRAFDGIKLGGVRMNYGVICSSNYERCKTDNNGKLLRNDKGNIVYIGDKENNKYLKVSSLLDDKQMKVRILYYPYVLHSQLGYPQQEQYR